MPVRVSRATSVIVHQVPHAAAERFLALEEELTRVAEQFPGYQATEVYPPGEPGGTEWVVVLHFENAATMQGWLDAPVRAAWVAKVGAEVGTFRQETLATGFGAWFTGPKGGPPGWKMVLTVLLGLYPTVIILTLTLGTVTGPLGLAVSMLIGNAVSVLILQFLVMPVLTHVFGPWLRADRPTERAMSAAGVGVILSLLAGLTLLFRQFTG
ncbi:antibiotic biosynthesis monooxygenase [Gemmata sp.]|uniref:antibiotic biosynthesis monooxygenase n=1 Tax=Gemmata sp. TaxID=1914242 RepID=UPI003F722D4A